MQSKDSIKDMTINNIDYKTEYSNHIIKTDNKYIQTTDIINENINDNKIKDNTYDKIKDLTNDKNINKIYSK